MELQTMLEPLRQQQSAPTRSLAAYLLWVRNGQGFASLMHGDRPVANLWTVLVFEQNMQNPSGACRNGQTNCHSSSCHSPNPRLQGVCPTGSPVLT